jgi:murein DD-endopeptidase MepM/ murein hydrolase activator NlpD
VAGCGFCSTNHQGLDFTPGSGYPINSIADGVVSLVEVSGGGLGNQVVVDHVVNGQKVQSVYGHMQYGSIKVAVGQSVTVGQVLGNVGSTGASTGAHLHLEIHLDGTPIDPFAWLQANAN